MADDPNTMHLLDILSQSGKQDIDRFSREYLKDQSAGFTAYMDRIIADRQLKRKDVFQKADIPQKYGYKLLTGETRTAERDKLLRILFSMEMNLKEINRALTLYGLAPLYPKIRRDAVLIIAVNRGLHSVDKVSEWLAECGEPELMACRE